MTTNPSSIPTPADVAPASARPRPAWFFDHRGAEPGTPESTAQRRARLRDDIATHAERLLHAARALRCWEEDPDLALEQYARALARLDAATDAFDAELDKTTIPAPCQLGHPQLTRPACPSSPRPSSTAAIATPPPAYRSSTLLPVQMCRGSTARAEIALWTIGTRAGTSAPSRMSG